MIGEWPMLYDELHLEALQKNMGIKISFVKNSNNSVDSFMQIAEVNPAMLFINKLNLMPNSALYPTRKCVSTIIAEKVSNGLFYCHTFDKDLEPYQQINVEVLYNAWVCASDYDQLNQCNISIEFPHKRNQSNIFEFSKKCMKSSLTNYITPNSDGNIYLGHVGIKKFSDDILSWGKKDFHIFIDCAMYIDILVKQRICFISTLKELSIHNKEPMIEILNLLIEHWNKLKMLLFIVGIRKQSGAIHQLSENIAELRDLEVTVVSQLIETLR